MASQDERVVLYREWVATLACAIYNGEDWDKQTVAAFLHMGESRFDYMFAGDPPERLTEDEVIAAIDRIFERAGI